MNIRVGNKRFEDEYRKNDSNVQCCTMKDRAEEKGKWPCGVCKNGVGNSSILCLGCKNGDRKRMSKTCCTADDY